jgi:hypothetical protein
MDLEKRCKKLDDLISKAQKSNSSQYVNSLKNIYNLYLSELEKLGFKDVQLWKEKWSTNVKT